MVGTFHMVYSHDLVHQCKLFITKIISNTHTTLTHDYYTMKKPHTFEKASVFSITTFHFSSEIMAFSWVMQDTYISNYLADNIQVKCLC